MSATQEDEIHRLKTSNTSLREDIVNLEHKLSQREKERDEARNDKALLTGQLQGSREIVAQRDREAEKMREAWEKLLRSAKECASDPKSAKSIWAACIIERCEHALATPAPSVAALTIGELIDARAPLAPAPSVATGQTLDIDKEFWNQIKEAAMRSKWMPPEYMMNDWLSDVCDFLENGSSVATGDTARLDWALTKGAVYCRDSRGLIDRPLKDRADIDDAMSQPKGAQP